MLVAVLVVLIVIIVVIGTIISIIRQRKRAEASMDWARERGWHYVAEDPEFVYQLGGPAFTKGTAHQALNVVRGSRGQHQGLSAEYQYKTQSTDSEGNTTTKRHHLTVTALELLPRRPEIAVAPRTAFGRLTKQMVRKQVLTGDTAFDAAFRIDLANAQEAQAVLIPAVKEYCMQAPKDPFGISGTWLLTWSKGKRDFATLEREFQYLEGLMARVSQVPPVDRNEHPQAAPPYGQSAPPYGQSAPPYPQSAPPYPQSPGQPSGPTGQPPHGGNVAGDAGFPPGAGTPPPSG